MGYTGLTIALYVMVFLFGIVVGSFLNVCILRLPKGESIVRVPSHCTSCGKRLHWWELIPLFSWLALRGRCSGCRARISAQYPLIEAANGLLWILTLGVMGLSWDMLLVSLLLSALLTLSVIDARTFEITPGINWFILALGVIRLILYHDHWLNSLLGFAGLGGAFLLIWLVSGGRAMGGGDVKLVAAAGLFLGLKAGLLGLVLACFLGAVIHVILMKVAHKGRELAFGPYLSAGFAIAVLWAEPILNWYLAFYR